MRKFLVWPDGTKSELSSLTFEEFSALDRWVGGDDVAFRQFLCHNGFHELDSFREEVVKEMRWNEERGGWEKVVRLELTEGEPVIDWGKEYGS